MTGRRRPISTLLAGLLLAAAAAAVTGQAEAVELGQAITLTVSGPGLPGNLLAAPGEGAWLSHAHLPPDAPGMPAPAAVHRLAAAAQRQGHRLVLSVGGAPPPGASRQQVAAWAGALAEAVGGAGPGLAAVAPLPPPEGTPDWNAYLLKQAAVAMRAARESLLIALPVAGPAPARLRALYQEDLAPYVDAWLLALPAPVRGEALDGLQTLRLELDPGAALWVSAGAAADAEDVVRAAGGLLRAGAAAVFLDPRTEEAARALTTLRSVLDGGDAVLGGPPAVAPVDTWSFFDAGRAEVAVLVATGPRESLEIVLPTFDVSSPRLVDLATGQERVLFGARPDQAANRTLLPLGAVRGPALVTYRRFATPGFGREEVAVGAGRDPTVEEILARHQQVRSAALGRLQSVQADALIEFHYTIAGSGAVIDVAYRSRYFYTPQEGAEFEYLEMYVNGARWTRDRMPDLPLIQPEKVITPPLQVSLGRQYAYRLEGRDRVSGRPAWKVAFEPLDPEATRYRGTAWIDRETFRLLRQAVVQTGLEPPVLSSEEIDQLDLYPLPGGGQVSLVRRTDGQQVWNTAGANFIVNKEIRYENVRVNEAGFEDDRSRAYASDHQMLRDTEEGLRYLERTPAGERRVQPVRTSSRFLLGGGFWTEALDYPVPFVGVNLFDFDLFGRGQQINAFLAGAANFVTWADPALGDSRLDAAASVGLVAFPFADRFYVAGQEREEAEVKRRSQSLSVSLGLPMGQFMKWRLRAGLAYENYQRGEETAPGFVTPSDTPVASVGLQWQLNRRGFTATADGEMFRRRDWQPWGDPDPASDLLGSRLVDFSDRYREGARWSLSLSQDVFLRAFQKVRLSGAWLDGSDLDRFSRYQFSFFSERLRLRGFSGSGIRFDRGGLARARYTFNVADAVSFDAGVDLARVENRLDGTGFGSHAGIGFGGRFLGPWGLIMQVEYGLAVRSDLESVEGEQEAQLLFLKVF